MKTVLPPVSVVRVRPLLSRWDLLAMLLVAGLLAFLGEVSRHLGVPLTAVTATPISLDPGNLPEYAARTTLRMLAAMALSLLFTFTYATLAAKSRRAEQLLIPLLDILQSVPILGFISVTVLWFLSLAPGRVLGAELAAVFAIFTSQAWNMAFSFYQSLRTVPTELSEAATTFRLSAWMRFWRLEVPFALPALVWNMMMSMSGGWFFVVASEAISAGSVNIELPGIGSYIAQAIARQDLAAIAWAILTMAVVILIYDQLLFRPLVAWSSRFRFEQEARDSPARSWVLTTLRRSGLIGMVADLFGRLWGLTYRPVRPGPLAVPAGSMAPRRAGDRFWYAVVAAVILLASWRIIQFLAGEVGVRDVLEAAWLGCLTMLRVLVLIVLASLVWVPVGVLVGLRPGLAQLVQPVAQFLAAFPANLVFPIAVWAIVSWRLSPDVWLSPLMILGTQWYILFNVIAGASTFPRELRDVGANLGVKGWLWWRRVALPGVLPFYLTGAITASGGSWNASIVAEGVSWGDTRLYARGLGSYIAQATTAGDMHRVVLGIVVMSAFVLVINRVLWRPLYWYAERRFRLA